jgi:hypothetical protein
VGKKDAGLTGGVGIDQRCLRLWQSPATKFVVLGFSRAERRKGERGGRPGLFIARFAWEMG